MKFFLSSLVFLSFTFATSAKDSVLRVMSFNLRYASTNQPNAWTDRRPIMKDCLRKTDPDIIGTQEALYLQINDLSEDFPEYDWIGLGRDGGSRGEFMAVFYRKDRFKPLAFDHFWLSETPDLIASTTWGNQNRRMVTWVKFLDRNSNQPFYLFNTHFDHQVQVAREKAAALVRERIVALSNSVPVILTGDFNAAGGNNKAYSILTDGGFLTDTWTSAKTRRNETIGTFNSFSKPVVGGPRIDWILTRNGVVADSAEIVTFSQNGKFPSDHFPLLVSLRLGEAKK
ncbi:MAG: endonuclease/exonuclease/phosphatase family protein [Verrucomicrobiota bacterium]